jgi:hypothetical protein
MGWRTCSELAVHAAGQGGVDRRHMVDIGAIIETDVGQVVGEGLAACEMLFPGEEAAAHRMAAGVDDAGIGQDQMDQADMLPVVGHLVDEMRLVALAMDAGAVEIFLAQPPPGRGTRRRRIFMNRRSCSNHRKQAD